MNCSSTNGRINIIGPNRNQFSLFDKIPTNECSTFHDAMTGNFQDSTLSLAFFSKENMQIIQNAIRAGVYEVSNQQYIIDNQNCDNLKIVMRSVFLQNSVNLPDMITEQIKELNLATMPGVEFVTKDLYQQLEEKLKLCDEEYNKYQKLK